jgi:hypothetical protein
LYDWWNLMAQMYAKYGVPSDIEEQPEWEPLQKIQTRLLETLHESTGTEQEILFENLQRALHGVLGTEATRLSYEQAVEVIEATVRLSAQEEAHAVRASGLLN